MTPKSCFYHVYYESYGEIRKFGNPAIRNLAILLSGGFKIALIQFPMPENILVDTKIMFLSQLDLELSILARGKVAISKTVPTVRV